MRKKRCKRCGKVFTPKRTPFKSRDHKWTRCCELCGLRNLFDGLGMPTPPELLDVHTLIPTLLQEEYRRKLEAFEP